MIGAEEKRRLIDAYRDSLDGRKAVARSAAGLLIVALVAGFGASYAERDETAATAARANPQRASIRNVRDLGSKAGSVGTTESKVNAEAGKVSGKRVASGR